MKVTTWLFLFLVGLSAPAYSETPDPKQAVQQATDELLAKLIEVRPLYDEDAEQFFSAIDESLSPFIDFDGFARGVMAKFYRRASDEQKARFSQTFRTALIRTYASALVEFDNQEIVVLDPTVDPKRPNRATIGLEIRGGSDVYLVEYTLTLKDDAWLLRNVSIEGINIGLQFRSQFASFMSQYKNNIDDVIDNWTVAADE